MSLPVFLAEDLGPDLVELRGAEGRHAATVRRLRVGEGVALVDGRGGRVTGTVAAVLTGGIDVAVAERAFEPVPTPRLVLVQALAKGDRGELAVELATEVGVDEIVPWAAARCVAEWHGDRGARARARWQAVAREAAKQSRRAWVPEVAPLHTTAEVVARLAGSTGLVLHEAATSGLARTDLGDAAEVLLVVGPEGGLTDTELAQFGAAGGQPVRLGQTVLRTSTAGAVAAAVLSVRTGRW